MPQFSIIIPTYNRAYILHKPIDSILAQTYTDWELIIVDDGSTDDTKEIVLSYNDARIRYVWQENQERSAARNHGIRLAKGEWICFQDSDDEYLSNHLEILWGGIIANPEFLIFRTGMFIYNNGEMIKKSNFQGHNKYALFPFDAFTTFAINKSCVKDVKFDTRFFNSEDLHFLARLNTVYPIKILEEYTNIYHYDEINNKGIGRDYLRVHSIKIEVFSDLLHFPDNIIIKYLERKLCLSTILILYGNLKYDKTRIPMGLLKNIGVFIQYPIEYVKILIRITFVKVGEWSDLYHTEDRF